MFLLVKICGCHVIFWNHATKHLLTIICCFPFLLFIATGYFTNPDNSVTSSCFPKNIELSTYPNGVNRTNKTNNFTFLLGFTVPN